MKRNTLLASSVLLALSSFASAAGYLGRLTGIDQGVICMAVWFASPVVVILFSMGAFLYATGEPTNRTLGKNYMLNAFAGLLLTATFLGISFALLPTLTLDKCLGEAEKTCESAGGKCGCSSDEVCKEGSRVTDVSDCPDTCCKMCVTSEKTCAENGYRCGECPDGKKCDEKEGICDGGEKCCDCVDKTCTDSNYNCGCPDGWECEEEKPELPGCDAGETCCAKCKQLCCVDPSFSSYACANCMVPILERCIARESDVLPGFIACHGIPGCHYLGIGYNRCGACCSGDNPVNECTAYQSSEACEDNPCQISQGGCVKTKCKWVCSLWDTTRPCCVEDK